MCVNLILSVINNKDCVAFVWTHTLQWGAVQWPWVSPCSATAAPCDVSHLSWQPQCGMSLSLSSTACHGSNLWLVHLNREIMTFLCSYFFNYTLNNVDERQNIWCKGIAGEIHNISYHKDWTELSPSTSKSSLTQLLDICCLVNKKLWINKGYVLHYL